MQGQPSQRLKWSLFSVSALLGLMLTAQITSSKTEPKFNADVIQIKSALSHEIQQRSQLKSKIYEMQDKLNQYKSFPENQQAVLEQMKKELTKAEAAAGLKPVEGDGIRIEIKESPTFSMWEPNARLPHPAKYHIWDYELDYLINILRANGATAISFNGQRIVSYSGIREVGISLDEKTQTVYPGVMQVNFYPVSYPYVIDAIGDVEKMKAAVMTYIGEDYFIPKGKEFVLSDAVGDNKLKLPAFTGTLHFKYATEEKAEGAAQP
ncbi:DUF881 domain-containing protein [Effusibacillus dendaii]|uniref:DUF881 domain-containing protein n=1 Tax=Effusibacillus dendaii TaxID=2743772 RepID=A0A7I8D7C5_9BACL|nr:DUF881 domain-containing protein [Effusibacillus dendaii]BCJ86068.1 hypothetical protein skT53_10530 [Effusibacillus dendaii]